MNKIAQSLIAATAAIVLLAGCSNLSENPFVLPASATQNYIASVHATAPSLTVIKDKVLIDSGQGVCSALEDGKTADALFERAVDGGLTEDEGNAIIHSAIDAFCPNNVWSNRL